MPKNARMSGPWQTAAANRPAAEPDEPEVYTIELFLACAEEEALPPPEELKETLHKILADLKPGCAVNTCTVGNPAGWDGAVFAVFHGAGTGCALHREFMLINPEGTMLANGQITLPAPALKAVPDRQSNQAPGRCF